MIQGGSASLSRVMNVAPKRLPSTHHSLPILGFRTTYGDSSVFHGTQLLEASDGSGLHPHLVLQDDVFRYLQASEDYIQRVLKKDRETTSLSLGFQISGLQIYDSKESGFWRPGKKRVLCFTVDDTRLVLRKFVSSNSPTDSDSEPYCSFASAVYGGSTGILAQLLELKA